MDVKNQARTSQRTRPDARAESSRGARCRTSSNSRSLIIFAHRMMLRRITLPFTCAAAGETLNPEKPQCRRVRLYVRFYSLAHIPAKEDRDDARKSSLVR